MIQPIRVLHVVQRMEAAGVQTLLMNLYRNIDKSKVQFDFLVHYQKSQFFDDEIQAMGGQIYRFSVREDYNFIKYSRSLRNFFKEHPEYRIVHGHMHSLGVLYLKAAANNGVPVRIAHSHNNSTQNDMKKFIKTMMIKRYAKYATDLMACSEAAGKYMFGDVDFRVINNAIDSEKFVFDKETRLKKRRELRIENKFVIGSVGRFEMQKNQKFSVCVFEQYLRKDSDAVLLLIGSGSMDKEVREFVAAKGLTDKVLFLGVRSDVAQLYQAMDVFLMPSLFEGLGIVGVEAQAAGTPVVCTDTLPHEIDITPLVSRVSLAEPAEVWADAVERSSLNTLCHSDMRDYIKAADYDIRSLAAWFQDYYIDKYFHGNER